MENFNQNPSNPEPQPNSGPSTPPPAPEPTASHHNTGMAVIAYLGVLILIPLLTEAKNDPFVKFHIKQGLLTLIGFVVASMLYAVVLGWFLAPLVWLASVILMVIGVINASKGKQVELPVVGHLASHFHF